MSGQIRVARLEDAEQILEIYAPVVFETVISFELEAPSLTEMRERIMRTQVKYPWLVMEDGNRIQGYAYATAHRERPAYQWSADVSVYVRPEAHRRGIARGLYEALLQILRALGYYNVYAGIAQPNAGSVALHEALGFTQVAIYQQVGYKLGAWRNVGWWQLSFGEHPVNPPVPKLFSEMRDGLEIGH
jgi:L-amino acid N-acyltransferase YncA